MMNKTSTNAPQPIATNCHTYNFVLGSLSELGIVVGEIMEPVVGDGLSACPDVLLDDVLELVGDGLSACPDVLLDDVLEMVVADRVTGSLVVFMDQKVELVVAGDVVCRVIVVFVLDAKFDVAVKAAVLLAVVETVALEDADVDVIVVFPTRQYEW